MGHFSHYQFLIPFLKSLSVSLGLPERGYSLRRLRDGESPSVQSGELSEFRVLKIRQSW